MRIALIAPLVSPIAEVHLGGAQAVVSDLARELTRRGHDVVVYAARGSAIEGVSMAPVDVDSTALGTDLFRDGGSRAASPAMVAAYRKVYGHAREGRYDVVHNHGFDAPAIAVAAEMGVAALHTLHLPPNRAVAAAVTRARAGPTRVWCAGVSRAQAAAWRSWVSLDGILRNGVPVEDIGFRSVSGASAMIAARFSAEKGVDEGIAASRSAGRAVDVFGTPYDAAYERAVRRRWGGDPDVRFHPPAARTELWQAVGAAAAAVCLSQWEEPFGMFAAEAQAAGTPVVASRRGGLAEVIRDDVTGYLVPVDDQAAAADALVRVHALSRADCRRHALRSLNVERAAAQHESLYARIARAESPASVSVSE